MPFGAEGAADRAARAIAASLSSSPLQFENLPGDGGARGLMRANALADAGEPVLLLGTPTTHVLLPARRGISPHAAFHPLVGLGSAPNVLLVPRCLGVATVAQLVERARHEHLVYASAGAGQTIHVCSAYFCRLAGIEMTHRVYDGGSATAYADFNAGRVHMYFDSLLGCRERIASGEAIPLAVSAARRSVALPQVPTMAEAGWPAHALAVWLGVFGANTQDASIRAAGDASAPGDRLLELGLEGGPRDAASFALQVQESRASWGCALESVD